MNYPDYLLLAVLFTGFGTGVGLMIGAAILAWKRVQRELDEL